MIKYKALFLLAIFLLHNAVGLACALIMPRQIPDQTEKKEHFHTSNTHSHTGSETSVHSHAATTSAHSHEEVNKENTHHHKTNSGHQHAAKTEKEEACCQDEVSEIAALAKVIPQKVDSPASPLFFAVVLTYFYQPAVLVTNNLTPRDKYFVRSYHPPIPEIRIAIQSFLI